MAGLNPTPEELTELRTRVTRICDNCEGEPNQALFAPYSCPECKDNPGKTSDPWVSVDEVLCLINEVERLRAEIARRNDAEECVTLVNFGKRCENCNWCKRNSKEN